MASRTQNGASPAPLPSIVQPNRAERSVVTDAGVAVKCSTCAAAVVAVATALSGLVGWESSSR